MNQDCGVSVPFEAILADAHIQWTHVDGPLLTWASHLHWLTRLERLLIWLGRIDANDIADVRWGRNAAVKRVKKSPPQEERAVDPTLHPWHPMKDPVDVKHLGKLGEEAGELGSVANRCLIQGVDEAHPLTGKLNRDWLEDEIADVIANAELCVLRFNLNRGKIDARVEKKKAHLRSWHLMA